MKNVGLSKAVHMLLENVKIDAVASSYLASNKRRGLC